MKNLVLMLAVLALAAGGAHADRVQDTRGTITETLDGADSTGWRAVSKTAMVNTAQGLIFDGFELNCYITNFAETDSTIAGEGEKDSAIFVTYAGTGARRIAISYDTLTLPCSLVVTWPAARDTSAAGVVLPNDTAWQVGIQDWIWFEYRVADTAGTGGSLQATGHWWIRQWEDN